MNLLAPRWLLPLALALAPVVLPTMAHADGPSADEIARKMLEHDTFGWEGTEVKARLVLVTPDGKREERAFDSLSKKDGDLVKSIVRFRSPERVAGTAFLLVQRKGAADEQYIYLPAYHTTRRIAGREREGSFMGSDFSYADLERRDQREAKYKLLPDEKIGQAECWVIESAPLGESPYAKIVTWTRKSDYIPLRIQFFGKDGQLKKTMFSRRIQTIDGKPVVVETHTEDAKTHHATDLILDDVKFRSDVPDATFNPAALEHG